MIRDFVHDPHAFRVVDQRLEEGIVVELAGDDLLRYAAEEMARRHGLEPQQYVVRIAIIAPRSP